MKLGILADTHDHVANTEAALAALRGRGVEWLIHCGDITKPQMVKLFDGWQTAFVYGNMDRNRAALKEAVAATDGPFHVGAVYELEVDGFKVGACHGDDGELLEAMISSGEYDVVFHGHLHRRRDERRGETRIVSPGALGGRSADPRSVCIWDSAHQSVEFVRVG
jgi:putative phosphoesterase